MRACILCDNQSYTTTVEQDRLGLQADLIRECGDIFNFLEHDPQFIRSAPAADVYVIDFGGLGVGLSDHRARHCVSQIIEAAQEKPGALFLIWSTFSRRWYMSEIKRMIEDEGGDPDAVDSSTLEYMKVPDNIVLYPEDVLGDTDPQWGKVRKWLGVESRPDLNSEAAKKADHLTLQSMGIEEEE